MYLLLRSDPSVQEIPAALMDPEVQLDRSHQLQARWLQRDQLDLQQGPSAQLDRHFRSRQLDLGYLWDLLHPSLFQGVRWPPSVQVPAALSCRLPPSAR